MKSTDIKLLPGWVLVKPAIEGTDGEVMIGGQKWWIAGGYENSHRTINVIGTVVRCCTSVRAEIPHMEWVPEMLVMEAGDLVWYAWNATRNAYDPQMAGRVFETSDYGQCILVPYSRCFAYLDGSRRQIFDECEVKDRPKVVTLLNGFILARPIFRETVSSKVLHIVEGKKKNVRLMEVIAVGSPNKEYLAVNGITDEKVYPDDSFSVVWPGDIVVTEKNTDIPLEGDFNKLFGEDLYRLQRKDVMCVVPDENIGIDEFIDIPEDMGIDQTGGITQDEFRKRKEADEAARRRKYYH